MNKIKGLLTDIKDNEQASIMILPFNTRIQDYQKVIKKVTQVYDKVFIDPYLTLIPELSNLNQSSLEDLKIIKNKPDSFLFFLQTFLDTQKNWKSTNVQIKTYLDQGLNAILQQCSKIAKTKDTLYDKLGLHEMKETQLVENVKKYAKVHKMLIQSLDSYKVAFQDVKLIYNIDEKLKRYKVCSSHFNSANSIFDQINKNIEFLTKQRQEIKNILEEFSRKQTQFTSIVGRQLIKIPVNLSKCMMRSRKQLLSRIGEKLNKLKEKRQKSLFEKFRLPFPNPQYFDCPLKQEQTPLYPSFLAHLKYLKLEHFGKSKKFFVEYYVSTRDDIKQRLSINQTIKNYLQSLLSLFDRIYSLQQKDLKDFINQKYIKIIQNSFYPSLANKQSNLQNTSSNKSENKTKSNQKFSESILNVISFLDQQKELTKNMNKFYTQHVKMLINQLEAEKDSLNLFKQQFKSRFYSLFVGKKQFKKDLEIMKSGEIQELSFTEEQVKQFRQEIIKKFDFILMLLKGFSDKSKTSSLKVKTLFQSFLNDYNKHMTYEIELCQNQNKNFDDLIQAFIEYREKTIKSGNDINNNSWLTENIIYKNIAKDNLKIKFDSQIQKVNQFKKLKKPTPDFEDNQVSTNNSTVRSISNLSVLQPSPSKTSTTFQLPFSKNYQKFVKQNTHFQQGQQYVGNFACGLCDNIIVSGRLYVTTNRLFFHSRFNSSNIFFGDTKLQIPRTDILKIEKKYNAIIFDNSISITTCNGQIFFTSLVSRDQAYEIICKTFEIDINKAVFQPQTFLQDTQQPQQNFNLNISQQDDLPDQQVQKRAQLIDQMILNDEKSDQKTFSVPYESVLKQTLKFPGLTAAKILKIFESGQQFPYKNKTFENFWDYFKGHVHKNFDMDIQQWQPSLLEYLNPSNIKKDSPLKFTRKIDSSIPAPETSIPFMPKFINCSEGHELYLYSRDKFVVIMKVTNSKAPYTDCFHLRIRKSVQKASQDSVKINMQLKIVFVKKTMMQGMIETRTLKQSRQKYFSMYQEMQNYLKYLEQKLIKNNQSGKNQDKINSIQKIDQNEIKDSQEQRNVKLSKKEENIQNKPSQWNKKLYQKGLLFSVILNFILLLIIFCGMGNQ